MAELLKVEQVMKILKCTSKTTIYKYMNSRAFPRPIKLSERIVRWEAPEVTSWIEERKQQRNKQFIDSKLEKKHEMKRLETDISKEKKRMAK